MQLFDYVDNVIYENALIDGSTFDGYNIIIREAIEKKVSLQGARIAGATTPIIATDLNFNSARFADSELKRSKFANCSLVNVRFSYSNFSESTFENVNMSSCTVTASTFNHCTFSNVDFSKANLSGNPTFHDSLFINCDFTGAKINFVNSFGMKFVGCKGLATAAKSFVNFLKWAKQFRKHYSKKELFHVWNKLRNVAYLNTCGTCHTPNIYWDDYLINRVDRKFTTCNNCGNCHKKKCCTCRQCSHCEALRNKDQFCAECNICNRCCSCRYCETCEARCDDNYCRNCGNCYDNECCRCENYNIQFFNSKLKFHNPNRTELKFNNSKRYISAEIEVSNSEGNGKDIANVVRKWHGSIVSDGSLPDTGYEINTAPAGGDLFIKQIQSICNFLSDANAEVTDRCGLHIHLDARDYNYYDIRRLVKFYAVIEPVLFGMVPKSRKTSHYCMPCGDKYNQIIASGRLPYKAVKKNVIYSVYESETTQDRRTDKYDSARYTALNLHSWFYRGTIECRMFNGTTNADKIINWGVMWAKILDHIISIKDEDLLIIKDSPYATLINVLEREHKIRQFIDSRLDKYGGSLVKDQRKLFNQAKAA